MSGLSPSPFQRRLAKKLERATIKGRFTQDDIRLIQRAFVEALKEEVEARFDMRNSAPPEVMGLRLVPLVISGLGSFKMKTRPQRTFDNPPYREEQAAGGPGEGDNALTPTITKPAARRLAFTSKWEPIDG